ncbi:uncharacterized protein EAF01_006468 [Botrytis porri]|uniref:uncharacterized protein n=1 Tax=Botrytis porri TaxID=87229 RepID=UPI0019010557|nr:uncharacterized protein EAF01_006468 [Botrytis porri]KAF7903419.1 hypothetical protein EAF01_006468 [Botrytis porri]
MTDLSKSTSEPPAQGAVSKKPAQKAPQLTIENVAELGFENELIRFAIFHTYGSIWEAANVLLRFRSDNPAQCDMQGTATSSKRVEKSNNETMQKSSTVEEAVDRGKSQSKEVAENAVGASTIANTVEEAKPTLPSNKSASIVRSRDAPTSCWPPGLQSHQSKRKQLVSSWKRDIKSAARLPAQNTTTIEGQHIQVSNNIPDNETQTATDSTEGKSKMDSTTIKTGTIIAKPTNLEKDASGSGIKRKLEIVEISDDDSDDGGADFDRHDSFQLKEESIAAENIAAYDDSTKVPNDSTSEQEPNLSPLVNDGAWRTETIAWANELFQKSKSHVKVSGTSDPPHHATCFKRGLQEKTTLAVIRRSLLELESKAFLDLTKCILEGAVASAAIGFNMAVVVLLISNHMPPKEGILALEAKYSSDDSYFTKSKLCGNEACRRPSHVIGESEEASSSRRICQDSRKRVLRNGQVPEDKCINGDKHYPECMRDLTLSDEASYRACEAHSWKAWHERPAIKVACGQNIDKKRKLGNM